MDVKIDQAGAVAAGEWQRQMVHDWVRLHVQQSSTDFANGLVGVILESTGGMKTITGKAKFEVGAGFIPSGGRGRDRDRRRGIGMLRNISDERKQAPPRSWRSWRGGELGFLDHPDRVPARGGRGPRGPRPQEADRRAAQYGVAYSPKLANAGSRMPSASTGATPTSRSTPAAADLRRQRVPA